MDTERARFNMVEQQIRPWDVLDQEILDLLFVVKRETFVPPAYRSMAFVDMPVPLNLDGVATGEQMLDPKTEARLLQELAVRKHEQVLEIGAGSGYMAALLGHRARHVRSLEVHPALAAFARANISRAAIGNVAVEQADGSSQAALGDARYDVIALSGAVAFVPDWLLSRLNVGGRLAAIVGERPVMTAQIVTRVSEAGFDTRALFETLALPLHGFPQKDRFRF